MVKLVCILALAILPIPATIFALVFVNLLGLSALLGVWIFIPDLGAWRYTACWVNLVGMRIVQSKLAHSPLSKIFPTATAEQNRSAAALIILGLIGAIRSGIAHNGVGIALGLVGAALLFFVQHRLFRGTT